MSADKPTRREFLQESLHQAAAAEAEATPFPRKELGKTGVKIPILLLGGGRGFDMPYDKRLHRALALGINNIDTALHYANGQSDKSIAAFIEQVGREKLWLTSKVSYHGSEATPERFEAGLGQCLESLKIDALDMFCMHGLTTEDLPAFNADLLKMIDRIKGAKKTRFFGFSCHGDNVPVVMEAAAKLGGFDAIMFRYNFRHYGDKALNKAIDVCKKAGIGLIAMKTQASVPEDQEAVIDFRSKDFSLAQAKLKAVWADERIDAICSHMANMAQLEENAAAALNPKQIALADFLQLNRLAAQSARWACLGCSHRCEAEAGATCIADRLRYLMYDECYHEPERAKALYARLDETARRLDPDLLARAEAACPQGIPLRQRLHYAHNRLSTN